VVLVLWLFVINLGIAFGAGLYEHRITSPNWITPSTGPGLRWDAAAARRDDTGRRFWAFVTTIPLTLLTFANLFYAWHASGGVRSWWLAAVLAALADRLFTFAYFIPTMVRLMDMPHSPAAAETATRWLRLNYVRHALVLAAWLTALKTYALFHQQP
jgi:hypothetical protein